MALHYFHQDIVLPPYFLLVHCRTNPFTTFRYLATQPNCGRSFRTHPILAQVPRNCVTRARRLLILESFDSLTLQPSQLQATDLFFVFSSSGRPAETEAYIISTFNLSFHWQIPPMMPLTPLWSALANNDPS